MLTCSQASARQNEPLYGTADKVDVWLMLEYNRPWRAKATKDNNLPGGVKEWLTRSIDMLKRDHGKTARLQFISQDRHFRGDKLALFIGINDHARPKLFRQSLNRYDDLETLDLAKVVTGGGTGEPQTDPVYFICTNGRRDRCCAVHGTPLYLMLARKAGAAAWKTTHLGGHRFAGNVLTLPSGASYGRVSRHDVGALVDATNAGELVLENLRGRTCFEPHEQIAEYLVRRRTGLTSIDAIRRTGAESSGAFTVAFKDTGSGETHVIPLARCETPRDVMGSCGDDTPKQVWYYTEA